MQSFVRNLRRRLRPVKRKAFVIQRFVTARLKYWTDGIAIAGITAEKDTDRVLIVRLDAIGDFILWLDYANDYKRLFPGAKLALAANSLWADVARRTCVWDEIIAVDLSRFSRFGSYRRGVLRSIRRSGFRVAIQPTYSRFLLLGDALIRASDARERIAARSDLVNIPLNEKSLSDRVYTRLLDSSSQLLTELERNAEFLQQLTGQPRATRVATIPFLGPLRDDLRVAAPYFVVFPGASLDFRQWPEERFAESARLLADENRWQIVLCGSSAEKALCRSLQRAVARPCIDLAGRTELWELIEVIRAASFLIGNETSAVHIAAAVGTPSVCLLGGGHYGRFVPYKTSVDAPHAPVEAVHKMACFNCNWHCTQPFERGAAVPCIAHISTATALAAAKSAISR